jgi:LAGLIDADG endonuclease
MKNNNIKTNITPWWLTGFAQADGSFQVVMTSRPDNKLLYSPRPVFSLTQSIRDCEMIEAVHNYLGVGQLSVSRGCITLTVCNLQKIMNVIIPHFDKYPLRGGKYLSYLRFKIVTLLKANKIHLTLPGLLQIIHLVCIRPGHFDEIMTKMIQKFGTLPSFGPIDINDYVVTSVLAKEMDINYITGLIDGDGSFNFSFPKGQRRVIPNITVIASLEDYSVLEDLQEYFGKGNIYYLSSAAAVFKLHTVSSILSVWPLLLQGNFNSVKRTYLASYYEALVLLQEHGVKQDKHLLKIVDLVYDMNQLGNNRNLSKTEYLKLFIKFI